jgi:hypothetical protein
MYTVYIHVAVQGIGRLQLRDVHRREGNTRQYRERLQNRHRKIDVGALRDDTAKSRTGYNWVQEHAIVNTPVDAERLLL